MAWDHLSVNKPHLVYIILGGFTSLFMLCSSFIKERMYIGEATVATICGIIFGPHAANLINPDTWGNTDQITLEFSRIVLVVQCFAVGVELPRHYMEKHWRSVVFLLLPVMTFGWLITSLFIWWLIPPLSWLQGLCVAACVTATDPVLASSVVGKGKFAKRVPKHLRDLLSAESGCNDGMAFPFIYLSLYLIRFHLNAKEVTFDFVVITVLYECVFGAIYGFAVGYIGRHGIKYAERNDLVDRESFLVFYFVLALFCAGSGSILGVDDLLVGFAAGVGFSNDGWFTQKTEESHVSNVIDLLINLAYFVYLGTIIPWEQYNDVEIGTTPWRLAVIAILVIFFRRIPIMMALKPLIPDIKTWREALFAGHFGPIGVGAIFVAILARAELETEGTTPLADYPDRNAPNWQLVTVIWPIVTFLVISSIIVHGSSIAVFTLGKHINTLTLTMSYTQAGDDGPTWMNRLPRISSISRSQAKTAGSETDGEDLTMDEIPPGTLPPPGGIPGGFLRRQREEDNPSRASSRPSSLIPRRRKKKWDDGVGPGGPISESAIYPARRSRDYSNEQASDTLTPGGSSPDNEKANIDDESNEGELGEVQHDPEMEEIMHHGEKGERRDEHMSNAQRHPNKAEVYDEGDHIIIENEDGDVIKTLRSPEGGNSKEGIENLERDIKQGSEKAYQKFGKIMGVWRNKDEAKGLKTGESSQGKKGKEPRKTRGPALAYQYGRSIIVEDEDGEVVKTYELPPDPNTKGPRNGEPGAVRQGITRMGTWTGLGGSKASADNPNKTDGTKSDPSRQGITRMGTWNFGKAAPNTVNKETEEDDDRRIRFTIGGAGRRLTKEDFLKEIQGLDPKARCEVVEESDAPKEMKDLARRDADDQIQGNLRLLEAQDTQLAADAQTARVIGKQMAKQQGARIDVQDNVRTSGAESGTNDIPESAAERRRRHDALKGVDEDEDDEARGRGRGRSPVRDSEVPEERETAAEKRRREAALGEGVQSDSDDDDTPRVPPPAARSRGIRFAQSPVRGKR
ncbi:4bbe78bc-c5d4-4d69-adf4-9b10c8f61686 [Sclerotinia trifoliorum]|uniref:4bbe78bc-c5d4-4d69-adf4-9b10c8f61686 n=1 Tax=Sclerotinia trifoliorum TaxID=28548 RepID=A0A8H2ZKT9_9HELO|nr:4bbe78bc-c5d4-4d69-adf4-9b10c8f61686 [Sclerotinia trifoliorum]